MRSNKSIRLEYSPFSLIRMVGKHKLAVAIISIVFSAGTIAIVRALPARYIAEALILVDSQKIPEKYVSSTVGTDLQDRLATISQKILSSEQLKKLIDEYDLYREEKKNHVQEEIIEMMRNDIKIKLERGWTGNRPGAFRVSYEGPVPTTVAEVANRVAQLFIDENLRTREVQAKGTSDFIGKQLDEAKKTLDQLEAQVSKFKMEHNGELPGQENALNAMITRLQLEIQNNQQSSDQAMQNRVIVENALSIAESEEATLTRLIAAAQAGANGSGPGAADDPKPRKQSEILEAQLAQLRARYSDSYPDVKRMREELARVKAAEEKDTKPLAASGAKPAVAPPVTGNPYAKEVLQTRERISTLRAQLKLANRELENKAAERKKLLDSITEYQKRLERIPIREQEMAGITRDYEISKELYRTLLEKKENAGMATDMEMSQKAEKFTPLDWARVPEKPFSPNRPLWSLLGCSFSLLLGVVFAVAREVKSNCLLGEWELPAEVATVARVPVIDFGRGPKSASRRLVQRALVSSAVISLLAVIAVGVYIAWNRF